MHNLFRTLYGVHVRIIYPSPNVQARVCASIICCAGNLSSIQAQRTLTRPPRFVVIGIDTKASQGVAFSAEPSLACNLVLFLLFHFGICFSPEPIISHLLCSCDQSIASPNPSCTPCIHLPGSSPPHPATTALRRPPSRCLSTPSKHLLNRHVFTSIIHYSQHIRSIGRTTNISPYQRSFRYLNLPKPFFNKRHSQVS